MTIPPHTSPVVIGYASPKRRGMPVFYCVFCRKEHLHGYGQGHRVAHCGSAASLYDDDASPFTLDGYDLRYENLSDENYLTAVADAATLHRWAASEVRRLRAEENRRPAPRRNDALTRALRLDRDAVCQQVADAVASAVASGLHILEVGNAIKGAESTLRGLAESGSVTDALSEVEAQALLDVVKPQWTAIRALKADIRRASKGERATAYGRAYWYLDATEDGIARATTAAFSAGVSPAAVRAAARGKAVSS